ncbi:hypothetical protein [Chromatium okenii]|jgi:superfamily I DNA and/or RNA helicase|uniref:Uncharacterized protein n=1 Tax=Chromatium okenii TaxID=61644 RepID=A0A2S7XPS0_9GAMM|nr:hypothetical protein [Chromatium okenii]PQJ95428.1 hypothetical protein CXB77_14555 [Chromatium okenii]
MNALTLSSIVLATEFALIAWAILWILVHRQRQQTQADLQHAGAVAKKFERIEISRRDALTTLFESTYRLQEDELKAKVDEYALREQAFYQAMLSLYLERDGKKLAEIPAELAKVLDPWSELVPSGMVDTAELEEEKAKLADELENTRHTLDELMKEYSAAFSNAEEDHAQSPEAPKPPSPKVEKKPEIEISAEELDGLTDLFDSPN